MKKVDVIINTYMLSKLQSVLVRYKLPGATVSNVQGMGIQAGQGSSYYSGADLEPHMRPKTRVEFVVEDKHVEKVIEAVVQELHTGNKGDGKIFIYDVADAVRIRTGERGVDAIKQDNSLR